MSNGTRKALPGEINYEPVDKYTLAHFAAGELMGAARLPLWMVVTIAVGWELAERPLKDAYPSLFPSQSQDSTMNATFDALAMIAGWVVFKSL